MNSLIAQGYGDGKAPAPAREPNRPRAMTETASQHVTVFHRSRLLDIDSAEIIVTVPTFRRPEQLMRTLHSIEAQDFDRSYCVVVVDNDPERLQGAKSAAAFLDTSELQGLVIVAHQRGNCHAYNAAWKMVRETFANYNAIAVIDDDEEAGSGWLRNLCETAERFSVDIVGAPQIPVFESARSQWLGFHPVFAPPYSSTGRVPILYSSGNALIARQVLESMPMPYLDPAFNFIGGGDSDFYSRAQERGFLFAWCATAQVYEAVPERRVSASWLTARSQREGAISALIETRRWPGASGRFKTISKSLLMLAASPLRAARLAMKSRSPAIGSYYIHVAIGRLLAEFGHVNEQYRNPEVN